MKSKLNTILIIFSIIPFVIITTITLYFYGKKDQSDRIDELQANAKSSSEVITSLIKMQETELSFLAKQDELVNFCTDSQNHNTPDNPFLYEDLHKILKEKLNLNQYYQKLSVYNLQGDIINSTSEQELHRNNYAHPIIQQINKTKEVASTSLPYNYYPNITTEYPQIDIASPIFQNQSNNIIGYIILTIDVQIFDEYLNSLDLGQSHIVSLVDTNGNFIFSHSKIAPYEEDNSSFVPTFKTTVNETPLSGHFSLGNQFDKNMYSYYLIDNLNWYVVTSQNSNYSITVYSYAISFVLICISVLLIFILISSRKIAKSFTSPILDLRDCMQQAADGDLTVLCNVKTKDEFGELSKSFNKMLHIIKSNYDELSFVHKKLMVKEEQLRTNYEHIEFLAYHDSLTKLPNKAAFYDYLNSTLNCEPGSTQSHAIYFVDLDNFKTVNDTLGHDYGDELLVLTAKRLNCFIKSDDLLARAGGDEFLIFKTNISKQEEALNFAKNILEKFKAPIDINGTSIYISMSIGVSLYPINGIQYNTLIKNADIAMYRSKDTGKNRLTLFNESMQLEVSRHSKITEVLRHAIEKEEVYLVYQPQYDLASDKIIGFEALMRIKNPTLGKISPTEFIPIAEESDLINELGTWALHEACRFNKYLQDNGFPFCTVAVNISTIQLNQKGFANHVIDILNQTGLAPEYLELEITESAIASSIHDAVSILDNLQSLGIRISLDDFGTGYSSLNYLTQMPIDTLKIDKVFIDKINLNEKDNYVAEAIISLAHNLEVKVVAEGVEDKEQLNLLKEKQCDLIQGYLYSKPLKPEDLIQIL